MTLEESHRRKFEQDAEKAQDQAQARRNFIPAKLEY
jgi:hypothetical protein